MGRKRTEIVIIPAFEILQAGFLNSEANFFASFSS